MVGQAGPLGEVKAHGTPQGFGFWRFFSPAILSKRAELGFEPRSISKARALYPLPVSVVQAPGHGLW